MFINSNTDISIPIGNIVLPGIRKFPSCQRHRYILTRKRSSRFSRQPDGGQDISGNGGSLRSCSTLLKKKTRILTIGSTSTCWPGDWPSDIGRKTHGPFLWFFSIPALLQPCRPRPHCRKQSRVSRGGRPDLAAGSLPFVQSPTLLIVGGLDDEVSNLTAKHTRNCAAKSDRKGGRRHAPV